MFHSGISTLQRWAAGIDMRKGHLKDVTHVMKVAAINLREWEKLAVLQFDEMKVEEVYEMDKTGLYILFNGNLTHQKSVSCFTDM